MPFISQLTKTTKDIVDGLEKGLRRMSRPSLRLDIAHFSSSSGRWLAEAATDKLETLGATWETKHILFSVNANV